MQLPDMNAGSGLAFGRSVVLSNEHVLAYDSALGCGMRGEEEQDQGTSERARGGDNGTRLARGPLLQPQPWL